MFIDYTLKKIRFLKDKKEIVYKERLYGILRAYKNYKRDSQYIHRFDKSYKKIFNEFIPYQSENSVRKYMRSFRGVYPSFNKLKEDGHLTKIKKGHRNYIPTEEVEEELFKREMCVFRDWRMWLDHRKLRNHKNVTTYYKRVNKREFWMIIPGTDRKFLIGLFLPEKSSFVEKIYNLLCENSYIFDETSEYYLPDKEIQKMIRRNFNTSKDLSFNIKDYAKSYNKDKIVK